MGLLDGRTAVVTGGSRGLGRAICATLAREGADVAFNYSTSDEDAAATAALIEGHGRRALARRVSVLDAAGLLAMAEEVQREFDGGPDILVNNAGVAQVLPFALIEEADWDRVMGINVKGAFLATRAFVRAMIRRKRGRIVNIGSLAGAKIIEAPVHYSASKAALMGFTSSLAKEFGRHRIAVNCVAPGLLESGVGANLPDHRRADYIAHSTVGRMGTFAEIAELVAFLASDRNSYLSGSTIVADGGLG